MRCKNRARHAYQLQYFGRKRLYGDSPRLSGVKPRLYDDSPQPPDNSPSLYGVSRRLYDDNPQSPDRSPRRPNCKQSPPPDKNRPPGAKKRPEHVRPGRQRAWRPFKSGNSSVFAPVVREGLGLFEDERDRLFLTFGRLFVFFEDAFDEDAHLGPHAVAHLPVHRGAAAESLGHFIARRSSQKPTPSASGGMIRCLGTACRVGRRL
jgi:hypothetical protein